MNINLISNSLLSHICALSLNKCEGSIVNIHHNELQTFDRYYSLNYFSKHFLESINVWEKISPHKITPYKMIEIYRNHHHTITFEASSIDIDYLGYIVSENELSKAVTETLFDNKSLNCNLDKCASNDSGDINIISDYADVESKIKSNNYHLENYNQTAININITHSKEHNNVPRQIFYKDEILGFLPTSSNTYNLIWTMPNELFSEISSNGEDEYLKTLEKRAKFILSEIKDLNVGKSFPLISRHTDTYYYKNNILIGESAHKFHPLAGLGLNMGMEDIHVLSTLISSNTENNIIFREYALKRIFRNSSLQRTLDIIIKFHSSTIISDSFKRLLLNIFDKSMFIKPVTVKNATGLVNIN